MQRAAFLAALRRFIPIYGSENIVYFDESSFAAQTYRPHAYALRGVKVYGDVQGKREQKTNLLMAQRRKSREWLAPLLFKGTCAMETVLGWIETCLLKELKKPSLIIMDNAPIHNKKAIADLLKKHGHALLSLPPYSPDLNPIEQSFGILKRRRMFLPTGSSLDTLFSSDCYLE